MQRPENPIGMSPRVFALWIEYPWPVAEKWAVIPLTVWLIGSGVEGGALSKSNKTSCEETVKNSPNTNKIIALTLAVMINLKFQIRDAKDLFK